jgi:hypothetical protein
MLTEKGPNNMLLLPNLSGPTINLEKMGPRESTKEMSLIHLLKMSIG